MDYITYRDIWCKEFPKKNYLSLDPLAIAFCFGSKLGRFLIDNSIEEKAFTFFVKDSKKIYRFDKIDKEWNLVKTKYTIEEYSRIPGTNTYITDFRELLQKEKIFQLGE